MMARLKWMMLLLAVVAFAVPGMASHVTLGQETQACSSGNTTSCISIEKTGVATFLVTLPNPLSGSTTPSGTYSFNGVGPLTFMGGDAANGSPFSSGTGGTLTVTAASLTNVPITWTLLDGDGHGYTLDFTLPGGGTGDLTASTSTVVQGDNNFATLFADSIGATAYMKLSSGEVDTAAEPASAALLLMVLGAAGLLLGKRSVMA
jgi:hypothetical protein